MLKPITLEVVGEQKMACEGCEERIENALKTLAGVSKVRAHSRKQRVEVLADTAVVDPAALIGTLRKSGYEARLAEAA